jgi:hypothetical protein
MCRRLFLVVINVGSEPFKRLSRSTPKSSSLQMRFTQILASRGFLGRSFDELARLSRIGIDLNVPFLGTV